MSSSSSSLGGAQQLLDLFSPPPSSVVKTLAELRHHHDQDHDHRHDHHVTTHTRGDDDVRSEQQGDYSLDESSRLLASWTPRPPLFAYEDDNNNNNNNSIGNEHHDFEDSFSSYHNNHNNHNNTTLLLDDSFASHTSSTSTVRRQRPRFCPTTQPCRRFCQVINTSTIAGSFMFLLYHIVFCLANASTIVSSINLSVVRSPNQNQNHQLQLPSSPSPPSYLLGIMIKLSAVGILFAGPYYIHRLGRDIPALYPSVDLFLAPFLARAAYTVNESLQATTQKGDDDEDDHTTTTDSTTSTTTVFLATFCMLVAIGMILAATWLQLARRYKLANWGTFLPYSVVCGFFSAVGVLLWGLAVAVDTPATSNSTDSIGNHEEHEESWWKTQHSTMLLLLQHHLPTLVLGILMHRLGPKHPFAVVMLILLFILGFYVMLWVTHTSLEQAYEQGWLWSYDELEHSWSSTPTITTTITTDNNNNKNTSNHPFWSYFWQWTHLLLVPPAPLSNLNGWLRGYVYWPAVYDGLGNMVAFSFLYVLRTSIHASAMKKNVSNLVRRIPTVMRRRMKKQHRGRQQQQQQQHYGGGDGDGDGSLFGEAATRNDEKDDKAPSSSSTSFPRVLSLSLVNRFRQTLSILKLSLADKQSLPKQTDDVNQTAAAASSSLSLYESSLDLDEQTPPYTEVRAKLPKKTIEDIFKEYSYALYIVSLIGGFGCCPTVATSNTMFAIGAEGQAPQYGSILLLFVFYCTNFNLVRFIPKTAFSALLVLSSLDTLMVWFVGAYRKTQDLLEWLVVPTIVVCSLCVGFLNAIFLGIAISTFVFVAAFFRVGVVKFNATGLEIRSRIERASISQSSWLDCHGDLIQVLVLQNYLFFGNASSILNYITTMFEDLDEAQLLDFAPPPKPKIVIVDVSLVTGMDTSTTDIFGEIRKLCNANGCKLFLSGLSPRMQSGLALGGVVPDKTGPRSKRMTLFFSDLDTALGRAEDMLIQNEMIQTSERRRFNTSVSGFEHALHQIDELHGETFADDLIELQKFVEPLELQPGECLFESDGGVVNDRSRGLFFIESGLLKIEKDTSHVMSQTRTHNKLIYDPHVTLKHQHARMGSVAKRAFLAKGALQGSSDRQSLRLARIGPGWVCGTYEHASGLKPSGVTVAITKCRLHHLPFRTLAQIEETDPLLVLRLYKMLSHLMARREEITIEHLSTLHTIMSSPAHSKPLSRVTLQAFHGHG